MNTKRAFITVLALSIGAVALGWRLPRAHAVGEGTPAPAPMMQEAETSGPRMQVTMVGHEFRQDDLPAAAAAPDGSIWVAWLSFVGDRDDVAIRRWHEGKWENLQWVPGTSGDNWLPQVAADASNRVWVVWSQQVDGNWDIYARRFDPSKQQWSAIQRLTNDPLPDINPRLASDGKGHFALVWQGFRGRNSNIFLKTFDGEKWSPDVRVTNRAANDWEPAVAVDSKGAAWVAYDSYVNGNYDVFARKVKNGDLEGSEIAVAATPDFEARATVAVDGSDRVWVAWEAGQPNWGKDQGYEVRDHATGVPLGGQREARIKYLQDGEWREPAQPVASAFLRNRSFQPHVFSDGSGSVWVAAKQGIVNERRSQPAVPGAAGYWEYWVAHWDGNNWSQIFELPNSKGRSSTRIGTTYSAGKLWAVWPTDNRKAPYYHRPHRQEVYAGILPEISALSRSISTAAAPQRGTRPPGHAKESEDVQAIRAFTAKVDGRAMHIVRGDFHRHTELSWDGGGGGDGNLQDFYRYMIDAASMDFGASTDHQGGAWPYWWWYTQKMTDMYHVPGAYVPIFGYERSAVYPFGHRNVFYAKRSESRVTPFFLKEGAKGFELPLGTQGDEPGVGTGELVEDDTRLLYEDIRPRNGISIPHTSATRMGTNWGDNDAALEPVVEIYQGARASSEQFGAPLAYDPEKDKQLIERAGYHADGFVSNAWAKGYKLGIITSSDHGSTHISYAMVYTDDPTRQGILDAIRKRHTYGAMDNIIMEVRMGKHFMGDEFDLKKPEPIHVKVRGTRTMAKVAIVKDNQVIYSVDPNQQNVEFDFTDKGDVSGRHFYYVRAQQDDDKLAWSSPFFINYK